MATLEEKIQVQIVVDGLRQINKRFKNFSMGLKRFRAELLGVMFAGQGMANMFKGILQPAAQLAGIFEIMNLLLGVLFLPIMLLILPFLLKMMDFFLGLSENTQIFLGAIALLGVAFGTLLGFLGAIFLAFSAVLEIFGSTAIIGALEFVITSLAGIFTSVLLPILAIVAVAVLGFWLAWKENFANIRDWVQVIVEGIKQFFKGLKTFFGGVIDFIIGLFTGDTVKILDAWERIKEGVVDIFKGLGKFILGVIVVVGISIFRGLIAVWKAVINFWKFAFVQLFNFIVDKINALIEKFNKFARKAGFTGFSLIGTIDTLDKVDKTNEEKPVDQTINFAPNVTVNASSDVDITSIVDKIGEQLRGQVDNLNRS